MGQYFQRAALTTAVMKYPETFADPGRANHGTSHAWYLCLELCFGICTSHSKGYIHSAISGESGFAPSLSWLRNQSESVTQLKENKYILNRTETLSQM